VGAFPEVWGRVEIDWRVAASWKRSDEGPSRPWSARAAPIPRLQRPAPHRKFPPAQRHGSDAAKPLGLLVPVDFKEELVSCAREIVVGRTIVRGQARCDGRAPLRALTARDLAVPHIARATSSSPASRDQRPTTFIAGHVPRAQSEETLLVAAGDPTDAAGSRRAAEQVVAA
jgi:hypothetical protein